jgi:hypothetical protein
MDEAIAWAESLLPIEAKERADFRVKTGKTAIFGPKSRFF